MERFFGKGVLCRRHALRRDGFTGASAVPHIRAAAILVGHPLLEGLEALS